MTTYSENCSRSIAETPVGVFETLTQLIRNWLKDQQLKMIIQRERRQLSNMSAAMLKDIGISPATAEQEAQRNDIPVVRLESLSRSEC